MSVFTPESLPLAVRQLFELNHYTVDGPLNLHGAEIDLRATPTGDPFGSPVYVEATVERVDNTKFGKDLTKLAMVQKGEPSARCLIVSADGFTRDVVERAAQLGIHTLTYDDLFKKFERFDPYLSFLEGPAAFATELRDLVAVYEEPFLHDTHGKDVATTFLTSWLHSRDSRTNWLLVVGEYGTGKTALTRVLQYRWATQYKTAPASPIPFRIELRNFTRQFDARGLLHYFLDHNGLSHLPIEFVISLVRSGRIVLILDGYDEMAQYLHARERRACLEALAELSADGARGILTSRPNYFTEAEELNIFEVLYASLQKGRFFLTRPAQALLQAEKRIDNLLASFLDRLERSLEDLTPEQTETLVARRLATDPEGRDVVLALLRRIFRSVDSGDQISLSGKPVIITYLLDVVEELKAAKLDTVTATAAFNEWTIYKLIVEKLMLRDYNRTPTILPDRRFDFLSRLSLYVAQRDTPSIAEGPFRDLVSQEFSTELRRQTPEARGEALERYFSDLRTSGTLTRSSETQGAGWRFSHNSLREFFLTDYLLRCLEAAVPPQHDIPVSDAMRLFVASMAPTERRVVLDRLNRYWSKRATVRNAGVFLTLCWDALRSLFLDDADPARACLRELAGPKLSLTDVEFSRISISTLNSTTDLQRVDFSGSTMTDVSLAGADLRGAAFDNTLLETVDLSETRLEAASFTGASLIDVVLSRATVLDANFTHVAPADITVILEDSLASGSARKLSGNIALGYLSFHGAVTDPLPSKFVYLHHKDFPILDKVMERLADQRIRQTRGLAQRGASQRNVAFGKALVKFLLAKKYLVIQKNRKDMVEVTDSGRDLVRRYATSDEIPEELVALLK